MRLLKLRFQSVQQLIQLVQKIALREGGWTNWGKTAARKYLKVLYTNAIYRVDSTINTLRAGLTRTADFCVISVSPAQLVRRTLAQRGHSGLTRIAAGF